MMIKVYLALMLGILLQGCEPTAPEVTQLQARPTTPSQELDSGEHALNLGGLLLVNGVPSWRDGIVYIPRNSKTRQSMPLLLWLHGGGGRSDSHQYMFPIAEEFGVVIVALDARHNTWDGIDSPFGPDVLFIDATLRKIFDHVAIDSSRIALGGLSDGGAYALALGRTNGDLFTHLIAVAPGNLNPPAPPIGKPKIFVAHGTRDNVYNVNGSRKIIVPRLQKAGYNVTYHEFAGPHWAPAPVVRQMLKWMTK